MSEGYAGQSEHTRLGMTEDEALVSTLHQTWLRYRAADKPFPEDDFKLFIELAHRGSTLAANILHLSNVTWDCIVGGEPYTYQSAVFHPASAQTVVRYAEWSNEESNQS